MRNATTMCVLAAALVPFATATVPMAAHGAVRTHRGIRHQPVRFRQCLRAEGWNEHAA